MERKAFQTSGSYAGTTTTTKLFSIFKTAIINDINFENNFNYLFENINKEPIDDLLPYSINIKEKSVSKLVTPCKKGYVSVFTKVRLFPPCWDLNP